MSPLFFFVSGSPMNHINHQKRESVEKPVIKAGDIYIQNCGHPKLDSYLMVVINKDSYFLVNLRTGEIWGLPIQEAIHTYKLQKLVEGSITLTVAK